MTKNLKKTYLLLECCWIWTWRN